MSNKFTYSGYAKVEWVDNVTPLSANNLNKLSNAIHAMKEFLEDMSDTGILLGKGVVIGDDSYTPDDDSLLTIASAEDSHAAEFTTTYVSLLKSGETEAFLLSEDDGDITLNILDLFKVLKSSEETSVELYDALVVGPNSIDIKKNLLLTDTITVSMGDNISITKDAIKLLSLNIAEDSIDLFEEAIQISEESADIFDTSISEEGITTTSLTVGDTTLVTEEGIGCGENTFTDSGIALATGSSFTIGNKTLMQYILDNLEVWDGGEY